MQDRHTHMHHPTTTASGTSAHTQALVEGIMHDIGKAGKLNVNPRYPLHPAGKRTLPSLGMATEDPRAWSLQLHDRLT